MKITAAAIQMSCESGQTEQNLGKAARLIQEAADRGCQWAVLPELFNTGYHVSEQDYLLSEPVPGGPTTQWMTDQAKKHGILLTGCIIERGTPDGVLFDTNVTVGPDGLLAKYRKIHLWGDECLRFSRGREFPTFKWKDLTVGMQICYEVGFPESARMLVLRGANVLVYSAAFGKAREYAWNINTRARALENGCYLIASGMAGSEGGKPEFLGCSRIVAPDGTVLAQAEETDEVITAEIDTDLVVEQRRQLPYLRDINIPLFSAEWGRLTMR